MLSFEDAYTLWRWLPFPRTTKNEGLIDTHGDLAVADEYVTTVIRFVERGIFQLAPVDVLTMLETIMRRISELQPAVTDEERAVAEMQHAYAALLHLVYSGFLDRAPVSHAPGETDVN
ncbi:hypothetical protein [Amycolatopsis sp. CA-126428]|uniref:hypothetical protein n=1 Tax=Amycolatopsis sp. CA-126428 TaxID=2073158 RepID=UPI000CD14F3A|nr:hypothetical protein [Amycolatopsis sp. CA-126428]